jgi:hypothetical protein
LDATDPATDAAPTAPHAGALSGGFMAADHAIYPRSSAMRKPMKFSSSTNAAGSHPSRKRTAKFLVPATAVLVAVLAGPFLSAASAEPTASCTRRPVVCTVNEPNVRQRVTEYPQIELLAGDHVFIEAGGCVQTGGHGLTWKRYVDPASDSDLYHGLISIPGVTSGLSRLSTLVNRSVTVTQNSSLILGYQDNHYEDNGYTAHDDGTANQCKNVGAAWVRLTIT